MRVGNRVVWILKLAFAGGAVYYLLSLFPLLEITASIAASNIFYVMGALGLSLLVQLLLAYRLRILTDHENLSLSTLQLLEFTLTSLFYGLFLPATNLAARVVLFLKLARANYDVSATLAAIVVDRIVATITVSMIGILFWLLDYSSATWASGMVMTLAFGGLCGLCYVLFSQRSYLVLCRGLGLIKLPVVPEKLKEMLTAINHFHRLSLGFFTYMILVSLFIHLLGTVIYYMLAISLGIDVSFFTMGWIRSVVTLILMVPISISGLGVREGLLLLFLEPYRTSGGDTLAFSLEVFTVTVLLGGALGGFLEGRKLVLAS
jgi:hypothetical protein